MKKKAEAVGMERLRKILMKLYEGRSKASLHFRLALLAFDIFIIASFIATTFLGIPKFFYLVDLLFALVVFLDLLARMLIDRNRRKFLLNPFNWADLVVILSLLVPAFFGDFAFLRVLRALRVLRSYRVLQELRKDSSFYRHNEEVIQRSLNLVVFLFIVSAFVYAAQAERNPDITSYTDALYFTVSALSTTGFGDIVLFGESGRWMSIAILIAGVGMFLRLLQSIFRPPKVRQRCNACGLTLHDADALHCKHCGKEIAIETEGDDG